MVRYSTPARARCGCGAVKLQIHGAIARLLCHCGICQRLNQAPYGDSIFTWRWHVDLEDPTPLTWKRYRWTPINVNRGTCRTCGTLMLEHLAFSPLSLVIARTWEDPELLPPPQGHVFYETRVREIDDGLPKWSGYLSSELVMSRWILQGVTGRG